MSDLYRGRKGYLTDERLQDLAKVIAEQLPDDAVVVVASTAARMNEDIERVEILDEEPEMKDYCNENSGASSELISEMQENIRNALTQIEFSYEGLGFDDQEYPVIVFSIESDYDYYALVAIAVETNKAELVDECDVVGRIIDFINAFAPYPEDDDGDYEDEESAPKVYRFFGTFANHDNSYDVQCVPSNE